MNHPISGYKIVKRCFIVALLILTIFEISMFIHHLIGEDKLSPSAEYKLRVSQLRKLRNLLIFSHVNSDLYKLYESNGDISDFILPMRTIPNNTNDVHVPAANFENVCDYYVSGSIDRKWALYEKSSRVITNYRLSINSDGIITQYDERGEITGSEPPAQNLPPGE